MMPTETGKIEKLEYQAKLVRGKLVYKDMPLASNVPRMRPSKIELQISKEVNPLKMKSYREGQSL